MIEARNPVPPREEALSQRAERRVDVVNPVRLADAGEPIRH